MRGGMARPALAFCFACLACLACSRELPARGRPPAPSAPVPAAALLELRLEGSTAFVTQAEIASCASERAEGGALLRCTLTPTGRDKLAKVTGASVGAVMEMVVEGKVRMRPRIEQAITGGQLTLWLGDDAEAERLAAALSPR